MTVQTNPCAGHECDTCHRCSRGRCCRRDNPNYALPKPGEWQPFIGDLGVLATDGVRAECHICGAYFGRLGHHVTVTHDVTADEYRALFGLNRGHGLAGPAYRDLMVANGKRLANLGFKGFTLTTEQRRQYSSTRRDTPEAARRRVRNQRALDVVKACPICGETWIGDSWAKRELKTCGRAECLAALAGPQISAKRSAPRFTTPCLICGADCLSVRYQRRMTCGRACLIECRRRHALAAQVSRRPDVRAKISAKASERHVVRDASGRILTSVRPAR